MSKRIMAPADHYSARGNQANGLGLLPLFVVGAAVAAVYTGIDPKSARAAALDLTRTVSSSLDGFMYSLYSVHACTG